MFVIYLSRNDLRHGKPFRIYATRDGAEAANYLKTCVENEGDLTRRKFTMKWDPAETHATRDHLAS